MITLQDLAVIYDFPEDVVAIFPQFEAFLKENDAYEKYMYNLLDKNCKLESKFSIYKIDLGIRDLVICSFRWKLTREGYDYWDYLDRKWNMKYL